MNKYKVGDKIVLTVSDVNEKAYYSYYVFNNNDLILWEPSTDKYAEPLSTYTEPLERKNENKQKQIEKLVDKLHRQATEITRLLAENKELKEDKAVLNAKIDAYKLYGDQHEKAKDEIKVGDVYMSRVGNYFVIYDIDHEKGIAKILWSDLSNSARELEDIKEYYIKTGRHIDIDSFLKQIGGESDEK